MLLISVVQIILLLCLPLSIFLLVHFKKKIILLSIVLFFLSFFGCYQLIKFWPLDAIFKTELRISEDIEGYTINFVQKVGFDYYDTFFEVIRKEDGKKAIVVIDSDDNKWWFPKKKENEDKVYFLRLKEQVNLNSTFIDKSNMLLVSKNIVRGEINDLNYK